MEPFKITSVADKIEAEMIMEIFENNNILSYSSDQGAGGYMNVYMGYSVFGTDIYVAQEDVGKATKILKELEMESPKVSSDIKEENKFYRNRAYVARVMLGVVAITSILIMIVGYIL